MRTEPTRLLAAGDRVGSLEVVGARGHSPGHVAFLDRRDVTLYCGDAFSTAGGIQTAAKPAVWWFAAPALVSSNKAEALASAIALRDLEPAGWRQGTGRWWSSRSRR